ncbi:transporter [Pseudomonas syringae]|uniref:GntT/GntP/DsdX family permease n=1 Tax=Pseudomonas syringae TaxID=317 RepID=UPI001011846F|nr:SLC13 family permease [Pseudomonas syringae]MBI6560429.1 transporter [Pseudomonas syringae]MBI6569111.1 transporter [Pseudomonas syringae]MBI6589561.1 transporter [Pseudomonas syringae]MBI6593134.1 transporter [Pseudomonas syringae]MDC6495210.1 transporter [Pseudomonas syringae]
MTPLMLMVVAGAGIALLLFLVLKYKFQPFVALMLVSIIVALVAGVKPADLVATIEGGMGKTLGHIAIIIALGAMIGRIIELSGGAEALAKTLINRFGNRRTPLALTVAGFMVGIPVFFEVGVIILMPLAYGVARAARKPLLIFALPMCAALLAVHAFLPPHPGAVAAASQLGADLGRVLMLGIPIVAVLCMIGYFVAGRMTRKTYPMTDDIRAEVYGPHVTNEDLEAWARNDYSAVREATETRTMGVEESASSLASKLPPAPAPGFGLIIALILLPIVLILMGTLATAMLPDTSTLRAALTVLGAPLVALLIDTLLCAWLLGSRRGWSRTQVSDVIGSALPGVAMVILIAGAGGVFGKVLVDTGIGAVVSEALRNTGLPVLALGFLLTLLLRAVQGSTTVALVTTAGILSPLIATLDLSDNHLALLCLAMGGGGLAMSHINDAGYWMFTKLAGLNVADGLRTWTVLVTLLGTLGFVITLLLWPFV